MNLHAAVYSTPCKLLSNSKISEAFSILDPLEHNASYLFLFQGTFLDSFLSESQSKFSSALCIKVGKERKGSLFPNILNKLNFLSAQHERQTLTPAQLAPSTGPCFDICKTRLFNQILNFIQIREETDERLSPPFPSRVIFLVTRPFLHLKKNSLVQLPSCICIQKVCEQLSFSASVRHRWGQGVVGGTHR